MVEPIITIPTYWTRKKGIKKIGDAYFDHPTPLDGQETLSRTLDSLKKAWGKFKVIIITATTDYCDDKLNKAVENKVNSIIKPYRKSFPIIQFAKKDVKFLKRILKKDSFTDMLPEINLACYPTIRN